jgi:hypothetical protein
MSYIIIDLGYNLNKSRGGIMESPVCFRDCDAKLNKNRKFAKSD